ncbi:MAG: MarR family transcriptional regulator [Bacteroidales bacterium]|jgi:DNA-binding MarR family transcriptional regulator|nr:MarR family transcriptional regulator [Bacteroidales bacterium]
MNEDFLKELGHIGFTARIKRISDKLIYSAREHYRTLNLNVEPNWHVLFLLLKKEKQLTVTEIANQLQFSHPAVIKIVNKMKEKGYVVSYTDSKDNRKQFIQLSKKAIKELPRFETEWLNIQTVLEKIVDDDFLKNLNQLEKKLNDKSFVERYKEQILN